MLATSFPFPRIGWREHWNGWKLHEARISDGNNEAFSYFSIVKHRKTQVSGFPESFTSPTPNTLGAEAAVLEHWADRYWSLRWGSIVIMEIWRLLKVRDPQIIHFHRVSHGFPHKPSILRGNHYFRKPLYHFWYLRLAETAHVFISQSASHRVYQWHGLSCLQYTLQGSWHFVAGSVCQIVPGGEHLRASLLIDSDWCS